MAPDLSKLFVNVYIFSYDFFLTIYGLVTPSHHAARVVPKGCPGYNGAWPEYKAPQEGQSRCSCPAINAMANHGILPRDGKNITFKQLGQVCRSTYNFAPTFCEFVPRYASDYLNRSYTTGKFDLQELDVRTPISIEHDASLVRRDLCYENDQGKVDHGLVTKLLNEASGKDTKNQTKILTTHDLGRFIARRRAQSSLENKDFELAPRHKMFGSANATTLLTIFGGRVDDLDTFLHEERLPAGWQPRVRHRGGLTLARFNFSVFPVEQFAKKQEPFERQAALGNVVPPQ